MLENQRSILDYLAHDIHSRFGAPFRGKIYYPFASAPAKFVNEIDGRMPGVRQARPDISQAIQRHQPFDHQWLVWLAGLRNENGHRILSKHTRRRTTRTDFHLPDGGTGSVQGVSVVAADGTPLHPSAAFTGYDYYTDVVVTEFVFVQTPLAIPVTLGLIQTGIKAAVIDIAQITEP